MQNKEKIKVGISIGDLNGIGSEIVLRTFQDKRMLELCTPIIFASAKILSFIKKRLNIQVDVFGIDNATKAVHNKVNVVNVWRESVDINFGQEDATIGAYAIKSLKSATRALKENAVDVLVTAPINKSNIQADDFKFPGHTDYLNQELEGDSLMFMVANDLRVGLLTDHVAVKEVSNHITEELITKKLNTINNSLKVDFGIRKPKIAILGINPHSGDNGVIGKEDDEVLKPTLKKLNEKGMLTFGPYAADSFFGSDNYKKFDAVIAAYHDQGLIPFKTLSFGQGVNYTAGLSHVRTSPDHGTAYEIAGKGVADHSSFEEAVFKAISIYKKRSEYKELSANPLKKFKKEQSSPRKK